MKHKKLTILIVLFSIFYFLFSAAIAQADVLDSLKNGLVPCGRCAQFGTDSGGRATCVQPSVGATSDQAQPCTVCHFFVLIQNIINFFLAVAVPLVTLGAIYIAFLFMISGGSPAKITEAKDKLWLLLLGVFWIFGSWLVLNTILNFAVNKSVFPWPWNQINCQVSQPVAAPGMPGGSVEPPAPVPTLPGGILTEQVARSQLQQAGITINHANPCPPGVTTGCTTLEGLRAITIEGAKQFKKDCNCTVIVTGGTEKGHSTVGAKTHENGYKLDFARNDVLDAYITNNYTYTGIRSSDKAKLYKSPSGVIFAKESDHWDTNGWDVEF